jgi:hypothetical protein
MLKPTIQCTYTTVDSTSSPWKLMPSSFRTAHRGCQPCNQVCTQVHCRRCKHRMHRLGGPRHLPCHHRLPRLCHLGRHHYGLPQSHLEYRVRRHQPPRCCMRIMILHPIQTNRISIMTINARHVGDRDIRNWFDSMQPILGLSIRTMPGEVEFHPSIGIGMNSIRMGQVRGRAYWPTKIQERIDAKNLGNKVQSTFERVGQNAWNIIKFEQGYVYKNNKT